jgi:hypothetical protein
VGVVPQGIFRESRQTRGDEDLEHTESMMAIEQLFDQLDKDHSGIIAYEEWENFMVQFIRRRCVCVVPPPPCFSYSLGPPTLTVPSCLGTPLSATCAERFRLKVQTDVTILSRPPNPNPLTYRFFLSSSVFGTVALSRVVPPSAVRLLCVDPRT